MPNDQLPEESQFFFYTTPDGGVRIDVFFYDETIWLTQKRMAALFGIDVRTVNEHLQNIYKGAELSEDQTIRKFRIVQKEGEKDVDREVAFYNLDAIISVGYRVNSAQATQFRIWATRTLREYVMKGFVIDDQRLKNGHHFGKDYFDELLEKIREIRASERRFYQKITDLYATASTNYDPMSEAAKTFFATVQNKLHWAITGQTAAELIAGRADANKSHMGLTTWKNAPEGKIIKPDVSIAKNYLGEEELRHLNRIVNMYLDYAENLASKHVPMSMQDWSAKLDAFLAFNDYEILNNLGTVSAEVAKRLAEVQFEKFRVTQDREYISDFDRSVQRYLESERGADGPEDGFGA